MRNWTKKRRQTYLLRYSSLLVRFDKIFKNEKPIFQVEFLAWWVCWRYFVLNTLSSSAMKISWLITFSSMDSTLRALSSWNKSRKLAAMRVEIGSSKRRIPRSEMSSRSQFNTAYYSALSQFCPNKRIPFLLVSVFKAIKTRVSTKSWLRTWKERLMIKP